MSVQSRANQQLVCTVALVTILTHIFALVGPSLAATGSSQPAENAAASTQPLWSYQVKPANYINAGQSGSGAPYSSGHSSLFDAFAGLSQRQGALTGGSPLLSILPIILIAAGGLLLLLPMLTMMLASPFGGGPFGGGAGGFQSYGYPQVGLNKRRSLDQQLPGGGRGIIELIEHVSTTIEDLSRRYSGSAAPQPAPQATGGQTAERLSKRSKASSTGAANHHQTSANEPQQPPANHRPSDEVAASSNAGATRDLINSLS